MAAQHAESDHLSSPLVAMKGTEAFEIGAKKLNVDNDSAPIVIYPPLFTRSIIVFSLMLATFLVVHLRVPPRMTEAKAKTHILLYRLPLTWYV